MVVFLLVLLAATLGLLFQEEVVWMRPMLKPLFAATMLLTGTMVRREETRAFIAAPGRVLVGVAAQYTIMPFLAWALAHALDDPGLRVGLILLGCMPTAMASGVMTKLLRGDVLLAAVLIAGATFIAPVPLAMGMRLLADSSIDAPVGKMVIDTVLLVVLPVAVGVGIGIRRGRIPPWWSRVASTGATVTILFIVMMVVAENRGALLTTPPRVLAILVLLNAGGYLAAILLALVLRWPAEARTTLVVDVGMKNAGLGAVLALTHLGKWAALPSACYAVLCLLTVAIALPFRSKLRRT